MSQKQKDMFFEQELAEIGKAITEADGEVLHEIMHNVLKNRTLSLVTEEDVEERGGWPFPREMLAKIHIDLINEGALGVGWVISFPQPDRFGEDKELVKSIKDGGLFTKFIMSGLDLIITSTITFTNTIFRICFK